MAQPVRYKAPRRINVVSVTLVLGLAVGAYAAYQYVPLYWTKQQAFRVLEETGSAYSGRKGFYRADHKAVRALQRKMEGDLRVAGVDDPNFEAWIELDGPEARFGVVYTMWVTWPFNIIERQEKVYEVEHIVIDR